MPFRIQKHIIPCQHIRQHDGPSTSVNEPRLSVKQYSPSGNPIPAAGDVTIVAAHGNGFVKELYEPLWEDLERLLSDRGRHIRSIWIADTSNQGASGLLNEHSNYDDVSWYDHSRDLLNLVNHFRDEMIQPIVAIGHSMGVSQLIMLALGHPKLFSTLVLIDPIISAESIKGGGPTMTKMALRRKVAWPSRQAAEEAFSKAFKSWDPRVPERFNKYALHPYPNPGNKNEDTPSRLNTGRFQELSGFVRPAFIYGGKMKVDEIPWVEEAVVVHDLIGFIPCSTVYVCGELSASANSEIREDWITRTGTGKPMGKPGRKIRVEAKVMPGVGHFAPMESPAACAGAVASCIDEEVREWETEDEKLKGWRDFSREKKEELAYTWMANLKAKFE